MDTTSSHTNDPFHIFEAYASEGMKNAASGFSTMLGENVQVSETKLCQVPIGEIPKLLGGPEKDAVGVYLRVEGEISGQVMLVIPLKRSLKLADLLLNLPEGTTAELGAMERSALGEVGNLTASFFLNSLSRLTGISVRPSPPAVMVDMVGAIMDIIIATCGGTSDYVLLLQATLVSRLRSIETSFWAIPDPQTLEFLTSKD